MSEPTPRGPTPGYCSYCGEWTREGVVVAEIHSDSGPGHVVVRHPAHVGLRKVDNDRPGSYLR